VSALTLGSIIHDAFNRYYNGMSFKDITKWIDKTYKDDMGNLPPEEVEQAYLDSKTALGMFLNFPFNQMKFDKIESEKEFRHPLATDIMYVGRIDGLVMYEKKWFIREVKTTGENRTMFMNRASTSPQATGYVWGIQRTLQIPITGLLYDALRKPKLYKKVSEDMYQFGNRIYMDYCDKKKHKSYFFRYPTYRTQQDCDLWVIDTISTARHLIKSIKKDDFPRNTNSCWVYNQECPYRRICFERKPDSMVIDLLYEKRGGNNVREAVKEANGGGSTCVEAGGNEAVSR
jgi:hypothetical protein